MIKYISILDEIDSWLKAKDDKLASLIGFDSDKYARKFTIDPDLAARLQNSNQCLGIRFYNEERDEIATLTSWPCDIKKRFFCSLDKAKSTSTVTKAKLPCIPSKARSDTARNKRSDEKIHKDDDYNNYGRNLNSRIIFYRNLNTYSRTAVL